MHAINLSDKLVKILSKIRLNFLINFNEIEVYFIKSKAAELTYID